MKLRWLIPAAALCLSAACTNNSVNRQRVLNEECLEDRECALEADGAVYLRCLSAADNSLRCQPPTPGNGLPPRNDVMATDASDAALTDLGNGG